MSYTRRRFLQTLTGSGGLLLFNGHGLTVPSTLHTRAIPKTGEVIPAIGMGSWLTFAVGDDPAEIAIRLKVLQHFFKRGGRLIDSSPMYGTSEAVIGKCLGKIKHNGKLFSATKVWTRGWQQGVRQMERSRALWGIKAFDLMQIHNLLDWQTHLETLKAWKAEGRIRYIGVTTSHNRRHNELIHIMKTIDALDFVQFTYNIEDRQAEQHLLPLAAERRLGVIINRPFQRAGLFKNIQGKPLPTWSKEIDCDNWAQFFLKFITSHPAVTCAIPATSRVEHMQQNMGALYGRLPDAAVRKKMVAYYQSLA